MLGRGGISAVPGASGGRRGRDRRPAVVTCGEEEEEEG